MRKKLKAIAAALAAAAAMSCANVTVSAASELYSGVDAVAGIMINSVSDLTALIGEIKGKERIEDMEPEVFEWLIETDGLYIPTELSDKLSDITGILVTPTYVDTIFKADGTLFELTEFTSDAAGDREMDFAGYELINKPGSARKVKYSGKEIFFYSSLNESYYTWEEDDICFQLRSNGITEYSDETLAFCSIYKYDLSGIKTGWQTVGGKQYYYDKNGNPVTKSTTVDGIKYKFDKSGVCLGKYTGWVKTGGGDRYYYKNGVKLKSCWLRSGGKKVYYLLKNGKMAVGTVNIGGKIYTFGNNGRLINT